MSGLDELIALVEAGVPVHVTGLGIDRVLTEHDLYDLYTGRELARYLGSDEVKTAIAAMERTVFG